MQITLDETFTHKRFSFQGKFFPVARFIKRETDRPDTLFCVASIPLTALISLEERVGTSSYTVYNTAIATGKLSPVPIAGENMYFLPLIMSATGATTLVDQSYGVMNRIGTRIIASSSTTLFFKEGEDEPCFCFLVSVVNCVDARS